ncbi:Pycsar system effector family protein [Pontibacter korlensis]|nr:Pycsar system effector family protein [Pontibacter korlensis]
MMDTDILERTHVYVAHQLPTNGLDTAHALTLEHTRALVAVAEEVGRSVRLNEHDMQLLLLAAWLYDLSNHQNSSPEEVKPSPAAQFLESSGLTAADINTVMQCIVATQYPQQPKNLLEEVLCDAVASFMASKDYLLHEERKAGLTPGALNEELKWIDEQRTLLKKHSYFTSYARHTFSAGKEKNIKTLKQKREEIISATPELQVLWEENKKLKKNLQKGKEQKVIKGVETMFRTTMASHLQLSVIADSKANIMISINAIIASIMISSFIKSFSDVPHLIIPAFFLTVVCIVTTIIAVLATRPNIKKTSSKPGGIDYLFFGDYTTLSADVYRANMREIMHDSDRLYNSMIDNIYLQGKVLEKKYRLLKLSYTVFVIGLCLVLASYAIAWFFLA